LQFPKLFNGRKEFIQQNFILRFLLFSSSFFLFSLIPSPFSLSLPFLFFPGSPSFRFPVSSRFAPPSLLPLLSPDFLSFLLLFFFFFLERIRWVSHAVGLQWRIGDA